MQHSTEPYQLKREIYHFTEEISGGTFGSLAIRTFIENSGGEDCIPPKSNNRDPWDCDWWLYKERYLVECFFQKLKLFRRIATRYEKLAERFLAIVQIGCIVIWLA